jgi:hypothetical protein
MRQLPPLPAISSDALRRPDWTRIAKSGPQTTGLVTLGRGFNLKRKKGSTDLGDDVSAEYREGKEGHS